MEIVFKGKTYTKFQRLWNDINYSYTDDNESRYSIGIVYCGYHVGNLYRMFESDFYDSGYKLEAVLAVDKYDDFLDADKVIEYDAKNGCVFRKQPDVDRILYIYKFPVRFD